MKTLRQLLAEFLTEIDRNISVGELLFKEAERLRRTAQAAEFRSEIIELENSKATIGNAFDEYR